MRKRGAKNILTVSICCKRLSIKNQQDVNNTSNKKSRHQWEAYDFLTKVDFYFKRNLLLSFITPKAPFKKGLDDNILLLALSSPCVLKGRVDRALGWSVDCKTIDWLEGRKT